MRSDRRFPGGFSLKRPLKFSLDALLPKSTVRPSMLKIRLGVTPETEVKIPQVPPGKPEQPLKPISVRMSSHRPKMVKSYGQMLGDGGVQAVMNPPGPLTHPKSRRPWELEFPGP